MEKMVNYLNLTNGLEYMSEIKKFGFDFKFVRIQSTYCEQKLFDRLIQDLDYNFLFDIAQGNIIRIYDTSRNKKQSRALYQGVEFIKYSINSIVLFISFSNSLYFWHFPFMLFILDSTLFEF